MNTKRWTANGSSNSDIGSKVIPWDESRRGMPDRDQVQAGWGQSRMTMLDTNDNQVPYSHGNRGARSLIPERYGDSSGGNSGQESQSLPQPQHHMVPGLLDGQGNINSLHPRSGSSFGGELIDQGYITDQAPQSRSGATSVDPELSHNEIFRDAVTSPQPHHDCNSDDETRETGNRDQLDDPTQPQMGVDDVDETGSDLPSTTSQFSSLTIDTHGSSLLATESSGFHSPKRSEPSDSSEYHLPRRSAVGQASGQREAVSSFGQYRQEYNPSDVDSHNSIPSHCRIDSLGPPHEESRKNKRKTSENRQSGTRNRDQPIYRRTGGGAGMERPSSSGATVGVTHVRSSHGDREVITTSTHHKQKKKSKKEPYPAEVDDHKRKKMEAMMAMFTERVDPRLLQLHLRGCLKDFECYPAEVDDHKRKKMEAMMAMFTERVDPRLLQLHLRGCLKDFECEHILKLSDLKPRPYVNQTLWNYLKRAPYWWQNLERALEECGYSELLARLR